MTRWARRNVPPGQKALGATPWEEMVVGPEGRESRPGPLSLKKEEGKKKKNRKKKEYRNEDVNGFAAYLQESSRGGGGAEAGSAGLEEEVALALKKDKRREDRRLKRQERKKNAMVCFHCREPGHGVADCPAVFESQDMGTGICYRCGSTEHDISKCKAKIDPAVGAFPYAKCFICGEMGHLSRSCPDNPKGLYAEGGSCRLCGSVEHFRKDCPEKQNAGVELDIMSVAGWWYWQLVKAACAGKCSSHSRRRKSREREEDRDRRSVQLDSPADQVTVGRWAIGMSADYEEITEAPTLQKPKVKVPKVVTF